MVFENFPKFNFVFLCNQYQIPFTSSQLTKKCGRLAGFSVMSVCGRDILLK